MKSDGTYTPKPSAGSLDSQAWFLTQRNSRSNALGHADEFDLDAGSLEPPKLPWPARVDVGGRNGDLALAANINREARVAVYTAENETVDERNETPSNQPCVVEYIDGVQTQGERFQGPVGGLAAASAPREEIPSKTSDNEHLSAIATLRESASRLAAEVDRLRQRLSPARKGCVDYSL
jgi:hypothetical protein